MSARPSTRSQAATSFFATAAEAVGKAVADAAVNIASTVIGDKDAKDATLPDISEEDEQPTGAAGAAMKNTTLPPTRTMANRPMKKNVIGDVRAGSSVSR